MHYTPGQEAKGLTAFAIHQNSTLGFGTTNVNHIGTNIYMCVYFAAIKVQNTVATKLVHEYARNPGGFTNTCPLLYLSSSFVYEWHLTCVPLIWTFLDLAFH